MKHRPVELLRHMIQRNQMNSIKGFFQLYGTAEGCAMAVQLAVAEEGIPAVRHEGCTGYQCPEAALVSPGELWKGCHMYKECSTPTELTEAGTHWPVA